MKVGFYAGSFDPFTKGHLHVIRKSAKLFDELIVGIGVHKNKNRRFDRDLMKDAMEKILNEENLSNVKVIAYDNLSVDAAKEEGATVLVRGIRNGMDYEYEETLASINEEISGLDTIYIRAGSLGNISSSMVMELLENGKDVEKYLPKAVIEVIKEIEI